MLLNKSARIFGFNSEFYLFFYHCLSDDVVTKSFVFIQNILVIKTLCIYILKICHYVLVRVIFKKIISSVLVSSKCGTVKNQIFVFLDRSLSDGQLDTFWEHNKKLSREEKYQLLCKQDIRNFKYL